MKSICRNVAVRSMWMMALTGAACANADKPIWDYAGIVEVTIDRPAKDVWPYFFGAKEEMYTKVHYEHIAGESGKVGEIYRDAQPFHGAYIFYEAIKVKPEKQLVLKITLKKDEKDEGKLIGYDFHTFNEVAGHTTVVLAQTFALPVEPKTDLNRETEKQDKMLSDIFQNLKRLVENSH